MDAVLESLLKGNQAHVDAIGEDHFQGVREVQEPEVVSITCSDSRVSQEGMFAVDEPGWLFAPSSIGNLAVDLVDGERVVDGSLLYPVHHTGTRTIAVVGHTGCGAITAAYEATQGKTPELAPGIAKHVALLGPTVSSALEEGLVDAEAGSEHVVDQLVEVNVHEQVDFLLTSEEVPDETDVYGFVYDLQGAYGGPEGKAYLVNASGERDIEALRKRVPGGFEAHVASLL